jgi:capsular polysaccharide biosynthesis protein
LEIQSYWRVIRKRLWWIALIAAGCSAIAGYYSFQFATPQYEASAKLIVNQGQADGKPDSASAGSITSDILLIKTYKEIIRTPRIMNKVVKQYPDLNATPNELIGKVSVSSVNETLVMSVTARDGNPARAAVMANAVANVFQQEIKTLMNMNRVSVLYWADPSEPRGPVSPHPIRNVAVVLVLSLMAGISLAFMLDKLNDTVRTERDMVDRLGLPVLAEVPRMKRKDAAASGRHEPVTTTAGGKRNATMEA